MKSFLQRKLEANIHPEITYAFFNHTTTAAKDQECNSSSLSVSLTEEASLGMILLLEIFFIFASLARLGLVLEAAIHS